MKKIILLFVLFNSPLCAFDPLTDIDYKEVLNIKSIQDKHKGMFVALGCAKNLFDENELQNVEECKDPEAEFALYQKEIEDHYHGCIRRHFLKPLRQSVISFAIAGVSSAAILPFTNPDSAGFGMTLAAVAVSVGALLNSLMDTMYKSYIFQLKQLEELELEFLKQRCFIPHRMWAEIEMNIKFARDNSYNRRQYFNAIKFGLGMTCYKNKKINYEKVNLDSIMRELTERIDDFFQDYDDVTDAKVNTIISNVNCFLRQLCYGEKSARYLYLVGPGGTGKTHFAKALSHWINELLPDSIYFSDQKIDQIYEIEGHSDTPGLFLKVLFGQIKSKKQASIVFLDEADWIAEGGSEVKRVFNGEHTVIRTNFFGQDTIGEPATFDVPPMLIIATSNKPIKDDALRTRFDCVEFPCPSKEGLDRVAQKIVDANHMMRRQKKMFRTKKGHLKEDYKREVQKVVDKVDNFRMLQADMNALLQSWQGQIWRGKSIDSHVEEKETPCEAKPIVAVEETKD